MPYFQDDVSISVELAQSILSLKYVLPWGKIDLKTIFTTDDGANKVSFREALSSSKPTCSQPECATQWHADGFQGLYSKSAHIWMHLWSEN